MTRHAIADRNAELVLGVALVAAGAWLLHDACERRGVAQPLWLRPFSFW
jgi:hypothetical protein